MIYRLSVTVPANTPISTPESGWLAIPAGTIEQQFLTFPSGCCGLVGARVRVLERVLWPSNPDQWFINNGFTYPFGDRLEVDQDGARFTLEGYNLDEVYEHTVTLELVVLPPTVSLLSLLLETRLPVAVEGGAGYG